MGSLGVVIYNAAEMLLRLLELLIFVRIILSWIPMINYQNPIARLVYSLTEPILMPIREVIRKSPIGSVGNMLDFSPIIAWLIFDVILMVLGYILL